MPRNYERKGSITISHDEDLDTVKLVFTSHIDISSYYDQIETVLLSGDMVKKDPKILNDLVYEFVSKIKGSITKEWVECPEN